MKVYGHLVNRNNREFFTFVSTDPERAMHALAEWCRSQLMDGEPFSEDDAMCVNEYFVDPDMNTDVSDQFEADLDLSITELRDAYCAAINAGLTEALDRGDEEWLDDQMQALNSGLPKDRYVYSSAELAEIENPYSLPETLLAESPINEAPPIDDAAWDPVWTAFAMRHEAQTDEIPEDCSTIDLAAFEKFIEPGRFDMETAYALVDDVPHVAGWTSGDYQFWVWNLWDIDKVVVIEDQPYCGCYCLPPLREWPSFLKVKETP